MCDALEQEFVSVSGRSIASDEEGAVLYFIKRHRETVRKDEVLSLAKVMTLEYRLFRKMREKLRSFVSGKSTLNSDAIQERFIKEAKDLCKGFKLPHTLDYYVDIFCTGFSVLTRGTKT